MKARLPAALAATLMLSVFPAHAGRRIKTAVLPVKVQAKHVQEDFHPGEFFLDQMIMGMNKVSRFDVLGAGDVERILDDNLFKPEHLKLDRAAELAETLKVRLLLFAEITQLSMEIETEDRVIIQTRNAVCTASVGGTLFDAKSGKSVRLGPYLEEERKMGAVDQRRFTLSAREIERMRKTVLERASRRIRSRIYKLYPLIGKVSRVQEKVVTIDIGSSMGVRKGYTFSVYGMVERENPVTGLPEKVRDEVSRLTVDEVAQESATCRVIHGEENPQVGSTVQRRLKR